MCPKCGAGEGVDDIHSWTEAYEKEPTVWCVFYQNECQKCGHVWNDEGEDCYQGD